MGSSERKRWVLMNASFEINIFPSIDNNYLFCNCFFKYGKTVVGDYEQVVLVNSVEMSLNDLIDKLNNYGIPSLDNGDIKERIKHLEEDISNSCLPTCIESFDGDFGVLCKMDGDDYLIIRVHETHELIKIRINKESYIKIIQDGLNKIKRKLVSYDMK